jgi:hypothetical protein
MIVSMAISFRNGALWSCAEDFESVEEGFLYAEARALTKYGDIDKIVVVPLRATGLEMCAGITQKLKLVRDGQALRRNPHRGTFHCC